MLTLTILINIIALLAWLVLGGHTILLLNILKVARVSILDKRDLIIRYIIPIWGLIVFYLALLLFWIVNDYDLQVELVMNTLWSIFHILTPVVITLGLMREYKRLKRLL